MNRPFPRPHPRYGNKPYPPPRKRSGCGTGLSIVGGLAGGALLFVVLLVVITAIGDRGTPSGDGGRTDATPTTTTESSPDSTSGTTTSTVSSDPVSPSSSAGQSHPDQSGRVDALADHPILQDPEAALPAHGCDLPAWQPDPSAMEEFFAAARDCLDTAWSSFLATYDVPFTPPTVHFPDGSSFDTECGTIEVGLASAAYYCQNHLYLPFEGLQTERYGNQPGVYLALFAHEYGHHVQEMTGIMDAAWEHIYREGEDSPEGSEMSRRKELQAQCFSGVFFGAYVQNDGIPHEMYEQAWRDQGNRGDDTSGMDNHGSNANFAAWWRTGTHNSIAECNTFAANSSQVA